MTRRFTRMALCGTAAIAASGVAFALTSSPAHADTVTTTLHQAIADLPVGTFNPDGYDRDEFPTWTDDDHDGCNTRYEVLIDEATEAPTVGDDCKLTGGKWLSYYDNEEYTDPSKLQIDHMVPLKEAWGSGARDWTKDDRTRYANDLGDERDLVAVTAGVNESKGDRDPAEWMPPLDSSHCRYLAEWTVVKTRWKLTVDQAEKDSLTEQASSCEDVSLTIETAI